MNTYISWPPAAIETHERPARRRALDLAEDVDLRHAISTVIVVIININIIIIIIIIVIVVITVIIHSNNNDNNTVVICIIMIMIITIVNTSLCTGLG